VKHKTERAGEGDLVEVLTCGGECGTGRNMAGDGGARRLAASSGAHGGGALVDH
jgi:hypothetical protein